ncbi:LLM class flavin-dependent oxidoreductase [Myxococcota bacterium]|nr:LLM class flavin-dependent oxidoreductase [Myxococcota bacterium]
MSERGVQDKSVKLGLLVDPGGEGGLGQAVQRIREAEQQGWDGVCLLGGPRSVAVALQAAAAAAAVTHRVRLGVEVSPGAALHPLRLAEDLSMIDIISAGRLEWMLGDSASLSRPDQEEATRIVREAWTGQAFSHAGPRWSFPTLRCLPTPEQRPCPSIWSSSVGASGERDPGQVGRWFPLDQISGPDQRNHSFAVCGRWVRADDGEGDLRFGPSEVPYADWAAFESGKSLPRPEWLYVEPEGIGPSEPIRLRVRELFLA